jgi:hypothetical protein
VGTVIRRFVRKFLIKEFYLLMNLVKPLKKWSNKHLDRPINIVALFSGAGGP